jgi:hypothetical protein
MRKKMLFLALALAATATVTAPKAQAFPFGGGPYHSCTMCATDENGIQCCTTCQCSDNGAPVLCPQNLICTGF